MVFAESPVLSLFIYVTAVPLAGNIFEAGLFLVDCFASIFVLSSSNKQSSQVELDRFIVCGTHSFRACDFHSFANQSKRKERPAILAISKFVNSTVSNYSTAK